MPIVRIEWMAGRTLDQKQAVAEQVTQAVAEIGHVRPEDVWVLFTDVAPSDWAASGRLVGGPAQEDDGT
jgi:4-oxalocrotonate tautomerase